MEENQESNWLDVNEAGNLSDCSVTTVRKWVSKHKDSHDFIKKDKGEVYVSYDEFSKEYPRKVELSQVNHRVTTDEAKHKKEAMQIAYNSELFKQKDETIKLLIQGKPFFKLTNFWVSFISGIIIVFLIVGGYKLFANYKIELIQNHKSKIEILKQTYIERKSNLVSNHNKTLANLNDLHLEKTNSLIQNNKHIIDKLKKDIDFLNYQISDQGEEINVQKLGKQTYLTELRAKQIQLETLKKEIINLKSDRKNNISAK